ncbi:DUF1028 domain-containing protein [Phytohabitans rumicis]|uniref:Putative peptidoglycan binding domain-containing protein n=1 Tax=Phytohabitans rumicis TaxID=1076125 RepID=A0A6V8KTQ0_9ACTN|nr:DUF1028 domain-containing protein [Phytohabitans rumicis]GFJ86810.1 hypothetical protein Prum_004520 [Phytohabitans rumicis]
MTFSIVARSTDGRLHGVAVASKFLAAGAIVPAAEAEVGALATQAHANLAYRSQGLALLRTGVAAADVVAGLVAADPGRAQRQLGVVGVDGDGATFTGAGCHDWAGGASGPGWAVQGNILAGPQVIEAMRDAWLGAAAEEPFAPRLAAALHAGDRAGGDRRGRQSAALLVVAKGGGYGGGSDVLVDLRVDDHPDPVAEVARLLDIHTLLFGRPDPKDLLDLQGDIAEEVAALLTAAGYPPGGGGLDAALAAWSGVENLEERMVPSRIDAVVLAHLRAQEVTR